MSRRAWQISGRVAALALAAVAAAGCGRGAGTRRADTVSASGSVAKTDTNAIIRGSVVRVSTTDLVLKADTGMVTVKLTSPLHVYDREPATLAVLTPNSFIGATTVKQPDGSQQATEIHIFPEELRGLGEGSRMMTQTAGGASNRMTNGAVAGSRMTNGAVAGSRMTNGTAAPSSANVGTDRLTSLTVRYPGGALEVRVPPDVRVTMIKPTGKSLTPGEQVAVPATWTASGTLTANKALIAAK